jgi:sugar phosphate isomerase/epimerase
MSTNLTRRQFMQAGSLAVVAGATPVVAKEQTKPGKPFRFGLNTATLRGYKLSLPEQIEAAAKAGYDGIEPWMPEIAKFVEAGGSVKELGQRCRDRGLTVYNAIGFAQWIVDDDAQRAKGVEQMKREMGQVLELGGARIAAPPAGAYKDVKLEIPRMAERYRVVLDIGHEIGVVPQLEFWGGSANLNHLAEALAVAVRSGHPDACVLPDVFHFYKGGTDAGAVHLLSRQAVHVLHMNDYPAQPPRETVKDSDRIWPGDGVAPIKQILGALVANQCEVMLSVEVFNAEYWKRPLAETAATGLAKMKAAVN